MSQSDTWLMIYGREKANLVVVSKTAFLLFSSNVKSSKFPKNCSGVVLKFLLVILKGWQCLLFIREHSLSFKKCDESLIRCQSPFFENLLYLD